MPGKKGMVEGCGGVLPLASLCCRIPRSRFGLKSDAKDDTEIWSTSNGGVGGRAMRAFSNHITFR